MKAQAPLVFFSHNNSFLHVSTVPSPKRFAWFPQSFQLFPQSGMFFLPLVFLLPSNYSSDFCFSAISSGKSSLTLLIVSNAPARGFCISDISLPQLSRGVLCVGLCDWCLCPLPQWPFVQPTLTPSCSEPGSILGTLHRLSVHCKSNPQVQVDQISLPTCVSH